LVTAVFAIQSYFSATFAKFGFYKGKTKGTINFCLGSSGNALLVAVQTGLIKTEALLSCQLLQLIQVTV
jgi:hypothetical protein